MKVVYGHTDSIYVQIDSIERAKEVARRIENEVRKKFPNVLGLEQHPVVLEFEKYYSALGVGVTKNRNAGMITWEDDVFLDKPKFTMTGFTAKRVSETKLAKEVQTTVLKMWASQKSQKEINRYLYDTYRSVIQGEIPLESIVKRSRLRENRFTVQCKFKHKHNLKDLVGDKQICGHKKNKYTMPCQESVSNFRTLDDKRPSISAGLTGIIYCWENTNMKFDDSYLHLKIKSNKKYTHPLTKEVRNLEYIAGITYTDLEGYTPDWEHYAEQVVRKAEPIYNAMGWNVSGIRNGTIQMNLTEWF